MVHGRPIAGRRENGWSGRRLTGSVLGHRPPEAAALFDRSLNKR
jgi:hypothetical protein